MKSYLSHVECTACGETFEADQVLTLCGKCGKVLYARYDLAAARAGFAKEGLFLRPPDMWRWFELLPVRDPLNIVSLGEGATPLLAAPRLAALLGSKQVYIKEEGVNPTGSFKARGLSAAVSKAKELGIERMAIPSAGNAAGALAAYGARAGIEVWVFIPEDTPDAMKREALVYGAKGSLVRGLINDAGRIVRENADSQGWFDVSTLKEPYRVEGKKTMGFELAEQLDWTLPDVLIYPTGGGTGIVGMSKAFDELEALGWIGSKRPKMVSVQAEGCAPIVKAFLQGQKFAEVWADAATIAPGIRVPAAIADYLILDAIRESGGTAVAVSDPEIIEAIGEMARLEGVFPAPEGAATLAAYKKLLTTGVLRDDESVVLFNTGAGLKTPELVAGGFPLMSAGEAVPGARPRRPGE